MIAKLPGDKKMFMGDNLEIVVLFQAAEIERLIENLDEYKLKYPPPNPDTSRSSAENSIGTPTKFKSNSSPSNSPRPTASATRTTVSSSSFADRTTRSTA